MSECDPPPASSVSSVDPSAPTAASLQYVQPKSEFEGQPHQNQPQQRTSISSQALNKFPQIKVEPANDSRHFGRDHLADGRRMNPLQNLIKEEVSVGKGQEGGYICEICGRGCWSEIHLRNHKSFRHGNDPEEKMDKWRCHRNGCDAELASKEDLQNHLVTEHNMEQEGQGVSRAGLQTTRTREQHFLEGKRTGKARSTEERKFQIYLWKLPAEGISNEEIGQHFAQFGPVAKVTRPVDWRRNGEPRNYGFVQFDQEDTAQQMLQEGTTTIKGHQIEIKEVRSKEDSNKFDASKNNTRDLRCWLQRSKRQSDGTNFEEQE